MSAYYCGLDVHKEYTYAMVLGPGGEIIAQQKMNNEELQHFLKPHQVKHVAMEATTAIAPIYRKLVEEGYHVHVSHPKETRSIAKARIKTDKTSSRALAELLRLGSLPESYMPPREIADLRERVRRRAFLVRQRAKLKTKIKSNLTIEGIKPPTGHGLFTRTGVEWLKSLGLEPVECYLRLIKPLNREILRLSRELRAMARDDPDVRLLMTIPGVGYYIGLLIKAEIGDVSRFSSGDHLASYAGLVPGTKSSGGVTHHGRITKEGSSWLRWAMVEAVHSHLRYDTPVTRLYHRVAERRGSPTAKVATARKLVTVCYSVLKRGKPYYNRLQPLTLRP
jgi:transposase